MAQRIFTVLVVEAISDKFDIRMLPDHSYTSEWAGPQTTTGVDSNHKHTNR